MLLWVLITTFRTEISDLPKVTQLLRGRGGIEKGDGGDQWGIC